MRDLAQDLRYAIRGLARNPGFTFAAVACFTLGIGANAVMFGVIDRLFLRAPVDVQSPGRVARLYLRAFYPGEGEFIRSFATYPEYQLFRDNVSAFSSVAAYTPLTVAVGRGPEAFQVRTVLASHTLFPLLGVRPAMGRFYSADDDRAGADPTAIIGYGFWSSHFGRDSTVLGRTLRIGSRIYVVIGVAPPDFTGADLNPVDVWLPIEIAGPEFKVGFLTQPINTTVEMVGRIAPGASFEQAEAQATGLRAQAAVGGSSGGPERSVVLGPIQAARGPTRGQDAVMAQWLGGVSFIVLLIACLNVANLLFARAIRRRREVAIRLAIGAGRQRLIRQLVVEGLLLSTLGAIGAVLLVLVVSPPLLAVALPGAFQVHAVDSRVLAFTLMVAIVTGVVSSLVPAIRATRPDLAAALSAGDRTKGSQRFHLGSRLLVGQVAMSLVLIVAAGLFLGSLRKVQGIDLGFQPDRLLALQLDLQGLGYTRKASDALYRELLERVQSTPGVSRASITTGGLFSRWSAAGVRLPDRPTPLQGRRASQLSLLVSADYFTTTGMRILRGRGFNSGDRQGSEEVAVVGESLAKAFWPGDDAVGKCFFTGDDPACIKVVGIAQDVPTFLITGPPDQVFYLALGQQDWSQEVSQLLVRTSGDGYAAVPMLRRVIQSLIPDIPFVDITPLRDRIDPQIRPWRLDGAMFGAYGALALVLTTLGLYGVLAYGVTQRTREIGIRMALGADHGAVVGMVLRDALTLTVGGVFIGAIAALVTGRAVASLLYGMSPRDPIVLVTGAVVLLVTALVAAYLPARRAARVDPMVALRYE